MFSKILLVCSLFFTSAFAFAQTVGSDIVYLHDGSMIRGTVTEYIVNDHVKIITIDEQVFNYPSDKIREVKLNSSPTLKAPKQGLSIQSKGYYNVTGIGVLLGQINNQTKVSFTMQMVNGHQLNEHLSFGFGTGIEALDVLHIPTFGEVRYNISTSGMSPFIAVQAGHNWALHTNKDNYENHYGGPMAGIELGIRNYISDHSAIVMGIGYRYQRLRSDQRYYSWEEDYSTERIDNLNRISLRLAFLFN